MKQHYFSNAPKRFGLLFITALTAITLVQAQTTASTTASDEQTIRNLVAQEAEGKQQIQTTDDRIFVSGAYPRPIIGKEMSAENQRISDQIKADRLHFSRKDRIERLMVSQAGDMAYEFGYSDLAWDTPEKKHVRFEASYLRIWRKLQGQWKVDVFFIRPNVPIKMEDR